jgi:DNA-binding transcriptional ArsR family regulator
MTTQDIMKDKCDEAARLLKTLSHPERLKILCELVEGEKHVSELVAKLGLSQSATSQFLTRMKLEGLVCSRKQSQTVFYKISDPKVERLMMALQTIFCN